MNELTLKIPNGGDGGDGGDVRGGGRGGGKDGSSWSQNMMIVELICG